MKKPESESRRIVAAMSGEIIDEIVSYRAVVGNLLARGLRRSQLLTLEMLIENRGGEVPMETLKSIFSHTRHPRKQAIKSIQELRILGFPIGTRPNGYSLSVSELESSEAEPRIDRMSDASL